MLAGSLTLSATFSNLLLRLLSFYNWNNGDLDCISIKGDYPGNGCAYSGLHGFNRFIGQISHNNLYRRNGIITKRIFSMII